jgi:radical SAM superfamily enzyme YgiQ (UPF0313 family)
MYNILIAVVPIARTCPQTGPALIKSYLESKGYSCKVLDWNIDLFNSIDINDWDYINEKTSSYRTDNVLYLLDKYPEIFNRWIFEIKKINPKILGLSLFSLRFTFAFTKILCEMIKKEIPGLKIILGGHATKHLPKQLKELLNKGLVDQIVRGEGEIATEKILQGCKDIIIENENIKDLSKMPFADYYDLDLKQYPDDLILIVGSRGCINHCHFCQRFSEKFRTRGGENIAEELLHHHINFGTKTFYLSDACSNGNMEQFKIFVSKIDEYNSLGILPPIKWRTQLSCRSKELMDEEIWKLMKKTGFDIIAFGLETGSERLRFEMGKRVKNEDAEFLFLQCLKNKIHVSVSMICGYYTETEEDFNKTLKFLKKWAIEIPAIKEVFFGGLLNLEKGSYLYDNRDEIGIVIDKFGNWKYKENDFPFRYKRWLKMKKFLEDNDIKYIQRLEKMLQDEMKKYE